jgi:hypothetical protein
MALSVKWKDGYKRWIGKAMEKHFQALFNDTVLLFACRDKGQSQKTKDTLSSAKN